MARSIITLTTDFGVDSPYVAAVKAVIFSIHPEVTLVDITHAIAAQDIDAAAWALLDVTPRFPAGTIHIVVVDPGVGSERKIVYAEIDGQGYVAPDNGVLCRLADRANPTKIITVADPRHWLRDVSATFHGRDIMAPVAAKLALGLAPDELGPPQQRLVRLDGPEVRILADTIEGEVTAIDSFGNLVTNITTEMLEGVPVDDRVVIVCDEHETRGIFTTYSDQPEMTLIALVGSSGRLELAIVGESAAIMLGVREHTPVVLTW